MITTNICGVTPGPRPSARRRRGNARLALLPWLVGWLLAWAGGGSGWLRADDPPPEAAAEEIRVGMSGAYTGRANAAGADVCYGVEACFKQVNAAGGIDGHRINLIAYDDHYEPLQAVVNTERLIRTDRVAALCSYYGAPATRASLPLVREARIPLVGAVTGADRVRAPLDRYVFHARSSQQEEIDFAVDHLVAETPARRIALFCPDDEFGVDVMADLVRALARYHLALAGAGQYPDNSPTVDHALEAIRAARPDAVLLSGTHFACAAFLRASADWPKRPLLCGISSGGGEAMVSMAGSTASGVFLTQVVPNPADADQPLVAAYLRAMKAAGFSQRSYASLEGYVNALILTEGFRRAGARPDAGGLVGALEAFPLQLGGLTCRYGPADHQGMHQVYLTRVEKGAIRSVAGF